ncbi:uncharacterized protein [Cherax quadricarinatus]|uniref:uncharacterized protein isoform X2 n=1 Tax=Cherax quadricarinatus TaxID=27406 RepID=UPI0023785047|nr:uncharacterized protein LOC128691380 isoform X2 [Cherax quadricarinatus]
MRAWALVSSWLLVCVWALCHASSPIRISVYGFPAPPGYGRRLPPEISQTRPRRNATYIVASSEINIEGDDTSKEVSASEDFPDDINGDDVDDDDLHGDDVDDDDLHGDDGDYEDLYDEDLHSNGKDVDRHLNGTTHLTKIGAPVNRMGVAAVRTRKRKLRPVLPEPRRRSQALETNTSRSVGSPPSIRPPALPPAVPHGFFGPPAVPGLDIKPPAPPVLPPSTPTPSLMGSFGPPAIPPPISSPSPPPGADQAQVTDIKCMKTGSTSSFMAVLSLPLGYNAIPVFEDRPTIDPTINTACRMIPTQLTNDMFQLIVSDLERCGVRECRQPNGETWLCLQLRFPLVNGLKLPEDEIIQIRCRPQDKVAQDTHVLRVATAKNGVLSTSLFEGGQQEFQCEIGLFRKLPGTDLFASIVTPEVELDLGEEVQLRSIVRAGDGWQYSRITTIIIQKVGAPRARSILNAADLVFADGCRNPSYKVIARHHPKRDSRNPLINNFTFRMFMFQDMEVGDTLMITANVIGCVDAEDCAPTNCGPGDDDLLGFGKRKKRALSEVSFTTVVPSSILPSLGPPYPPPVITSTSTVPSTSISHSQRRHENTTNWERNLTVKVKIPNEVQQESIEAQECRLYLFITLGVAAVFCFASIIFVVFILLRGSTKEASTATPVASTRGQSGPISPLSPESTYSSSLSTEGSLTSICSSPLSNFPVPPTVRHRKRQVNAELLKVFDTEHQFPYGSYYPGMLNYYGYMVVPRRSRERFSEKKSLRALKREQKRHLDEADFLCHCSNKQCGNNEDSTTDNHKSIIRISTSGSDTGSSSLIRPPKPVPRMQKNNNENLYSEIPLSSIPTMV